MKKRFLIFISLLLSLTIFIFGGCSGEARVKYVGDETNYSTISGDFADSGLATELTDSINLVLSSDSLTRTDEGDFPQTEISKLNENRRSTVEIYSITESGAGAGSGIFVGFTPSDSSDLSKGGIAYVLTCFHVINSAYGVNIRDLDGHVFSAGLIGGDTEGDIALLWAKVDFAVTVAKFGNSSQTLIGETVYAIGNPTGTLGGTVTKGVVSSLNRSVVIDNRFMELIQIDSAINAGSSGGGLFTTDGYLVAIINAGAEYKDGIGFAVPEDIVLSVAKDLLKSYKDSVYNTYGYVKGRVDFYSVIFSDVTNIFAGTYVSVTDIDENCSLYKAGLRSGDKITAISNGENGYVVNSAGSLSVIFHSYNLKIGDTLTLKISRSGETKEIKAVLNQYIYKPVIKTNS